MNNRGQGSFEYLLILSGVILVLVMILVVVQGQFSASSESFGQNVEHGQQVSCDSNTANEREAFLVLSLGFNEGSGTTTKDSSGNNNDGTLVSGPRRTVGKIRKGVLFDGLNDHVDVATDPSLDITDEITLSAWVKPSIDYASGTASGKIIAKSTGFSDGYWMEYHTSGEFRCAVSGSTQQSQFATTLDTNTWYHLACVYDGSTVKGYINGVESGSKSYAGSIDTSVDPLRVAQQGGGFDRFKGLIDEVRVYNKALLQDEVKGDMLCGFLS